MSQHPCLGSAALGCVRIHTVHFTQVMPQSEVAKLLWQTVVHEVSRTSPVQLVGVEPCVGHGLSPRVSHSPFAEAHLFSVLLSAFIGDMLCGLGAWAALSMRAQKGSR